MVLDEQDDINPDVIPQDLFEDDIEEDWFNVNDVLDIYLDKEDY